LCGTFWNWIFGKLVVLKLRKGKLKGELKKVTTFQHDGWRRRVIKGS